MENMTKAQLIAVGKQKGITIPKSWAREKMIEVLRDGEPKAKIGERFDGEY